MAAGIISKLGTLFGHCRNECKHIDCKEMRKMTDSICPECGKKIGYEIRFYSVEKDTEPSVYAHANCIEK